MSLHLEFEPDYWYMGFAIRRVGQRVKPDGWVAYTADGNTYSVVELQGDPMSNTLANIKHQIRNYHLKRHTGYGERYAKRRIEYIRGELEAECVSMGELAELTNLADYIDDGDVQMLEAAGVPEGSR